MGYNICEYGENDELKRIDFYSEDGTLTAYYVYEYDEKGNRMNVQEFSPGEED